MSLWLPARVDTIQEDPQTKKPLNPRAQKTKFTSSLRLRSSSKARRRGNGRMAVRDWNSFRLQVPGPGVKGLDKTLINGELLAGEDWIVYFGLGVVAMNLEDL